MKAEDSSKSLPRLRLQMPFGAGSLLGLAIAVGYHFYQWHTQEKLLYLDWPAKIGWPFVFYSYGGFSPVSEFRFFAFVADLLIWLILSLLLASLVWWAFRDQSQ